MLFERCALAACARLQEPNWATYPRIPPHRRAPQQNEKKRDGTAMIRAAAAGILALLSTAAKEHA